MVLVSQITVVTAWSFPKSKRKHANFKVNNKRTAFRSKFSKETLFDEVVSNAVYATNALYAITNSLNITTLAKVCVVPYSTSCVMAIITQRGITF